MSEVVSICKDSVHNVRAQAIEVIYRSQSKEIQCTSGEPIFHWHSVRIQIQISSFAV